MVVLEGMATGWCGGWGRGGTGWVGTGQGWDGMGVLEGKGMELGGIEAAELLGLCFLEVSGYSRG